MNSEERYKLYNICFKSKKGATLTSEETKWIELLHKKYPEEYREVQEKAAKDAMDEVNPFK